MPADPHALSVQFGLGRRGLPSAASFRRWMQMALVGQRRAVAVALRLVDADEGRQLNRQFRGRDYPTNVLSFVADIGAPAAGPRLIGDIAICAPVVLREAGEQGKAPRAHFAHMTIHGVLHLLGHDHVEPDQQRTMEAVERRLLAGLGIADPYA